MQKLLLDNGYLFGFINLNFFLYYKGNWLTELLWVSGLTRQENEFFNKFILIQENFNPYKYCFNRNFEQLIDNCLR